MLVSPHLLFFAVKSMSPMQAFLLIALLLYERVSGAPYWFSDTKDESYTPSFFLSGYNTGVEVPIDLKITACMRDYRKDECTKGYVVEC